MAVVRKKMKTGFTSDKPLIFEVVIGHYMRAILDKENRIILIRNRRHMEDGKMLVKVFIPI